MPRAVESTQNAFLGVPWIPAPGRVSLSLEGSLPRSPGQQLEQAEKPGEMGQEANCSQAGSRRLVFVQLVCTDIFTLPFRAKCQVKRERTSDSSARHLRAGSPAIAPCLTRAQWATFFFLFPPDLDK